MIGIFAADDDRLFRLAFHFPIAAHHANIGVIRIRAAAGEENMVKIAGCQFGQFSRQSDGWNMRRLKEGVVVGQFAHLARSDVSKFVTSIPDVNAPESGHRIEDFLAVAVIEPNTLTTCDHAGTLFFKFTLRGKRMYMMRGVQRLKLCGRHVVGDGGLGVFSSESGGWSKDMIKFSTRSIREATRLVGKRQTHLSEALANIVTDGLCSARRVAFAQCGEGLVVLVWQVGRAVSTTNDSQRRTALKPKRL